MSNVFCRACGTSLHESATDCHNCGAKQSVGTKSKMTAVILCFFFGFMGIHRFYLGRPFSGFMYILFCWTGINFIVAFIEFVVLAFTDEREINRKFGVKA